MSTHSDKEETLNQISYNLARWRGVPHEDALQSVKEDAKQRPILEQKVKEEQEKYHQEYEYRHSAEYLELKSYYRKKAWKNFLQVALFVILVCLLLKSSIDEGNSITIQDIFIASGWVSVFASLFLVLVLCVTIFGNYLIGGFVGILAIGFVLDKASELQAKFGISDEQLELAFSSIGVIYFLFNFLSFLINLKKSIKP